MNDDLKGSTFQQWGKEKPSKTYVMELSVSLKLHDSIGLVDSGRFREKN